MGHDFRMSRIGRLVTGLVMLTIGSRLAGIEWSIADVVIALWAIAGGAALFFALIILQAASSFWTIESIEAGNVLTYGGVQAAQYPLSLYADWFRGVLTFVIPLSCVAYFPVLTLLDHPDPLGSPAWLGQVAPVAGFIFLVPSLLIWRLGVRRYTSTGT
jgi:ABC-2 type transport system permease protein